MTREKAIKELDHILHMRSSGYYTHLQFGGKQDKAEEEFLDSLDMAIAALREQIATDTNVGCKTNADYIRSMTDEELAKWMDTLYTSCSVCSEYERCGGEVAFGDEPCDCECAKHYLEWLKQPWKEEA